MNKNTKFSSDKKVSILHSGAEGHYFLPRNDEIDKFLRFGINKAKRIAKATYGTFFFFNSDNRLLSYDSDHVTDAIQKIAEYCIEHKNKLLINPNDPSTIPAELQEKLGDLKIESCAICMYMGLNPGDVGAVYLSGPKYEKCFSKTEYELVESLALAFTVLLKNTTINTDTGDATLNYKSSLIFLLDNVSLTQKNNETNNQLKSVLEVSNLINSSRELSDVIREVFKSARSVFRAESVSLFLIDRETGELYFDVISEETARKLHGIRIPMGQGIVGIAAQENKSILVNDAQNDPRVFRAVDHSTGNITRNIIASPLIVNDETIGVIEVMNTIDRPFFTKQDLEIFESFSDSVAIAIHRRGLLDDLQQSNIQLERKLKEITSLHSVSASILTAFDKQSLLDSIAKIINELLSIGRVAVYIAADEKNIKLQSVYGNGLSDAALAEESQIAFEAFSIQKDVVIGPGGNPKYKCFNTDNNHCANCMMVLLVFPSSSKPFGVLSLCDFNKNIISDEDKRLLNTISVELSRGYENFHLSEQLLEISALEKEVEITSKIQQNILPAKMPEHCHIELSAKSIMARTMGGDFYDYYVHDKNGDISLLVADVSGKSLPAALFMAVASSIMRTILRTSRTPVQSLTAGNKLIYEESQSGMFVTMFMARYEPSKGVLHYASAGHNEMILMHADGSYELLSGKGVPLGTLPDYLVKYQGKECAITKDDMLILYTDGVVEAINPQNKEFGTEQFVSVLVENRHKSPEEIIKIVYDKVIEFSESELQYDDFTMMITKFKGTNQGEGVYNFTFPASVDSIPLLRDSIRDSLQQHGLSGGMLDDILLAVDEAGTNIIIHAFGKDLKHDDKFHCTLSIDSNRILTIEFIDTGTPFSLQDVKQPDPTANLDGSRKGGFGVYLIRSLMDSVEYFREKNKNKLILTKNLNLEE